MSDYRKKKDPKAPEESGNRRNRFPTAVQSILKAVLKRHGLDEKIARYGFVAKWPEIVGEDVAKRSRPERFRGRTLVVRVTDSVWAQELSFHKKTIITRLKRHLAKNQQLDDIVFVVGEV